MENRVKDESFANCPHTRGDPQQTTDGRREAAKAAQDDVIALISSAPGHVRIRFVLFGILLTTHDPDVRSGSITERASMMVCRVEF